MDISERTLEILEEAGWYEGRRIDITEMVHNLEKSGFVVFDAAKRFMEEFGELKLENRRVLPDGTILYGRTETINVNCTEWLELERNNLDKYLDERTIYMGNMGSGELFFYITESGKFITPIGFKGNDPWEFWENVFFRKTSMTWEAYYDKYNLIPYWKK